MTSDTTGCQVLWRLVVETLVDCDGELVLNSIKYVVISGLFIVVSQKVPSASVHCLILIVMMDTSKRGNINTAALVTTVQCNAIVVLCSGSL